MDPYGQDPNFLSWIIVLTRNSSIIEDYCMYQNAGIIGMIKSPWID
jgi:hypothetical protein